MHPVPRFLLRDVPALALLWCLGLAACITLRADELRVLSEGPDAWQTRVELIRSARKTIDVAIFIWRDDATGLQMAGLLHEATQRGVRVRVIADGLARVLPDNVTAALDDVQILRLNDYHPLLLHRPSWANQRLHDKLIIVDDKQMIIGGRNFTDRYYDRGANWNYIDLDLLVSGAVCAEARTYFDLLWHSDELRTAPLKPIISPLNGGRFVARTGKDLAADQRAGLRQLQDAMRAMGSFDRSRERETVAMHAGQMHFIHEAVPRTADQSDCVTHVEELLRGAKHEVWISTPWLVTTKRTGQLLQGCLDRGVKLHILTNSLNACQDFMVFAAHRTTCKDLAARGACIHLQPGPDSLHSKTIVVDGSTALAGTLNFDPRSEFWNTESMVMIRNKQAARELLDAIREQTRHSYVLDPAKPDFIGTNTPSPLVRLKAATLPVLRLFSPLIRGLL